VALSTGPSAREEVEGAPGVGVRGGRRTPLFPARGISPPPPQAALQVRGGLGLVSSREFEGTGLKGLSVKASGLRRHVCCESGWPRPRS
jgi:hypothetical protein